MLLLVPSGIINTDQILKGNMTMKRYLNFISLFLTVLVIINLTNIHTKYQFFIGASIAICYFDSNIEAHTTFFFVYGVLT